MNRVEVVVETGVSPASTNGLVNSNTVVPSSVSVMDAFCKVLESTGVTSDGEYPPNVYFWTELLLPLVSSCPTTTTLGMSVNDIMAGPVV